ncbi:MAG: ribosomal RNA small subunit methyltransferase A [bacterium]|nr:ribosomal RNA small subunit methyltransferase A [bacterium]
MTGADGKSRSQLDVLRAHGIRPVKRRGQNFLVDGNLARAIAQDTLAVGGRVLELGAGGGALTTHLLDGGAERVVCVEVDRKLCALLEAEFGGRPGFELVEADLARLDWPGTLAKAGERPVMAGNLPYVLTSTVLFALADLHDKVAGGVFMVQREVADRMTASPGGRDYGILAVVLGAVFDVRRVRTVPASVFWPRPQVASAIVELVPREIWNAAEYARFTATVKTLFGQRRKKVATHLRKNHGFAADEVATLARTADIDAEARPEHLTVAAFRRLAAALAAREAS